MKRKILTGRFVGVALMYLFASLMVIALSGCASFDKIAKGKNASDRIDGVAQASASVLTTTAIGLRTGLISDEDEVNAIKVANGKVKVVCDASADLGVACDEALAVIQLRKTAEAAATQPAQ